MDSKSTPAGDGPSWLDTSPADYDARLTAKGHKRPAAAQASLFFTATPTADRKAAPVRQELPGQLDIFGDEA